MRPLYVISDRETRDETQMHVYYTYLLYFNQIYVKQNGSLHEPKDSSMVITFKSIEALRDVAA